jgi:hypothetical protein
MSTRLRSFPLACLVLLGASTSASSIVPNDASARLRHGVIWYVSAQDPSDCNVAARRYEVGVTGREGSSDVEKAQIRAQNPSFRWFVYNSGTDNYVPPSEGGLEEYTLSNSICKSRGWDPEIAYMHYRDDTRLVLEGDTVFVPGWGAGSAKSPDQSRVPLYYKNLTRRLVNVSTAQSRELNRITMIQLAFGTPFQGTSLYPDGIFLDNTGCVLYNYGDVISGGHVLEAKDYARIDSPQFKSWFWNDNLGPFLTGLKDTLETAASWSKDRQRKYLMINCTNAWDDSYASRDVADILFLEFQYNPVRNCGPDAVQEAYRRDSLAAQAGITSFYSANMTSSVSGHPGSFSPEEVMLGNLCWFLTTRTPLTLFYQQGTNSPQAADWDRLTWIRAMDVADRQLGEAMGAPYTLLQGKDPAGHAYVVTARRYENGFVVLRNRGDWNEGIEPETAVGVPLPAPLAPVSADGAIGKAVSQVSLRNGQGAIFLGSVP